MTLQEYNAALERRASIISENNARRMRRGPKQPPLPVPPKPARPTVPVAYDADGNYHGRLAHVDECPEGMTVRWEPAVY